MTYDEIMAGVSLPLLHFLETGFWNPRAGNYQGHIGLDQVRSACREMARSMKRPFIQAYSFHGYEEPGNPNSGLAWRYGILEVPKLKRHTPIVQQFILVADSAVVYDRSSATLWGFQVTDHRLWEQLYQYILNDPECRKARRLTS